MELPNQVGQLANTTAQKTEVVVSNSRFLLEPLVLAKACQDLTCRENSVFSKRLDTLAEKKKNQKSSTENGKAAHKFNFLTKEGAAIGSTLDFQRHNCVPSFLRIK